MEMSLVSLLLCFWLFVVCRADVPKGYLLKVSHYCGKVSSGKADATGANVTITSDLLVKAIIICADKVQIKKQIKSGNTQTSYNVYYPGDTNGTPGTDCYFKRPNKGSQVYVLTVDVYWGFTEGTLMNDYESYTITCTSDGHSEDAVSSKIINQDAIAVKKSLDGNLGTPYGSNGTLKLVDVLGNEITASSIPMSKKVKLDLSIDLHNSTGETCGFERDETCIFKNRDGDDFDWRLYSGKTTSYDTGPEKGAAIGTYYTYIEVSYPQSHSEAVLTTSQSFLKDDQYCLSFQYHMRGATIGELRIEAGKRGTSLQKIWVKKGDQGSGWRRAYIDIPRFSDPVIEMVGKKGTSFTGDICIDDLTLRRGPCSMECRITSRGGEYKGLKTTTAQGLTCQKWALDVPHSHDANNIADQGNYCRNPDNTDGAPWCYTTNPSKRWQFCDVPYCSDEIGLTPYNCDAINSDKSKSYRILNAGCGDGVIFPKDQGFTKVKTMPQVHYLKYFSCLNHWVVQQKFHILVILLYARTRVMGHPVHREENDQIIMRSTEIQYQREALT